MLETFKVLSQILLGLIFGFGFWYFIFWFITNDLNLFEWHWATKIVYLFFSFASSQGIVKALLEEK